MDTPITFTPMEVYHILLSVCGAIITLSAAAVIIAKMVTRITKPNRDQNNRLDSVESEIANIKLRLERGNTKFECEEKRILEMEDSMSESLKMIIESLKALTLHALDGNNTDELKQAQQKLDAYLIDKI